MKRLTETEAKTLYQVLKDSIDPKDVIVQLIFETGCRVSEATPLGVNAIEGDYILIKGLKGSKNRRVKLSPNLLSKLRRLDRKPTFMRHTSKTRNLDSARVIISRRFHALCLDHLGTRYNIHTLRHTAISRLYVATKDIIMTQAWAGHRSANSTAAYINLENEEKANDIMTAMLDC